MAQKVTFAEPAKKSNVIPLRTEHPEKYRWKHRDRWPYCGIVNDLWRGVQAEQNYLVALWLFAYSEALGRMICCTTGQRGGGVEAFREFTEKFVQYTFANQAEWREVSKRVLTS